MGFDYKTAADLARGRPVTDEQNREFAAQARWTHDERESLARVIAEQRRELASQEAEIALLKTALLKSEDAGHNAEVKDDTK